MYWKGLIRPANVPWDQRSLKTKHHLSGAIASTFSIVGFDPKNGELGVAVQSKFPAVGAIVPWARAKVGAIATQALINVSYGPKGLKMMEEGISVQETVRSLVEEDSHAQARQLAIIDAKGRAAAHTGDECLEWAGHLIGEFYSCQGNILANSKVLPAMARAYEQKTGDLVDRLLEALSAGQAAGGDRRGQQSAAILVVREKGGYEGFTDRYVDLRVDDHPSPIEELKRVFKTYDITMLAREDPKNLIVIDGDIAGILQRDLKKLGIYDGPMTRVFDQQTKKALGDFVNINNFENKMREEGRIWKSILEYIEDLASKAG